MIAEVRVELAKKRDASRDVSIECYRSATRFKTRYINSTALTDARKQLFSPPPASLSLHPTSPHLVQTLLKSYAVLPH